MRAHTIFFTGSISKGWEVGGVVEADFTTGDRVEWLITNGSIDL